VCLEGRKLLIECDGLDLWPSNNLIGVVYLMRESLKRINRAGILLLAISLVFLSGCGSSKKEAQSLVKQGIASSDQLTKYYDSLVQSQTKYVQIQTFDLGPFDKDRKKVLDEERKAYASRADLARKLNATYVALGQLIDFDVAADIKTPVQDLTTAVLKQVPHPADLDSDLFKTVIAKIAGRLVEMQQEKQFRKNAPRVLEVLDGVAEIFERERYLYVITAQLYEDRASKFAIKFLGDGKCENAQGTAMGPLQELYQPYTVKLFETPATNKDICAKNFKASKNLIEEMANDRQIAASQQARSISVNLYNLERLHRRFLREAPQAPALMPAELSNIDRLVAALKDAMAARVAWENQHKNESQPQSAGTNGNGTDGNATEPPEPEYKPEQAVADYMATLLSPPVKDAIVKGGDTSSNAFRKLLLEDLNRIIETGNIFEGILSKKDQETLEQYRTNTEPKDRPGLRRALQQSVTDILVSDRSKTAKSAATPPASITSLVAADPVGKPLARLNRAILAFVFVDSVAPQTPAQTIAD
jgi:hypothetical protein